MRAEPIIFTIWFTFWALLIIFTLGASIYSMLFSGMHQRSWIKKLKIREAAFIAANGKDNINNLKNPISPRQIVSSELIMANVSMGVSWWQIFIGSIHQLFGGNITTYDRILAYGRDEAFQRLREKALANGWDDVINVRLETATVMQKQRGDKKKGGAFEFLVYGTGIKY